MTTFARSAVGLGGTLVLIASLLAGCGASRSLPTANARTAAGVVAKSASGYVYQRNLARKPVRTLAEVRAKRLAALGALEDEEDGEDGGDDAPPATTPSPAPATGPAGGLGPAPKPTPIPPQKTGGGASRAPDAVDDLLDWLSMYGYEGDRRHMVAALREVIYKFPVNHPVNSPMGWEPKEFARIDDHFRWWSSTFVSGETPDKDEYIRQSLIVAQNRINVRYYVWVSKQEDPQAHQAKHESAPFVNFNEDIPVVKAMGSGGWMTNLTKNGKIADYLRMPDEYLGEWERQANFNHLLPIPPQLYY